MREQKLRNQKLKKPTIKGLSKKEINGMPVLGAKTFCVYL